MKQFEVTFLDGSIELIQADSFMVYGSDGVLFSKKGEFHPTPNDPYILEGGYYETENVAFVINIKKVISIGEGS